MIGVHYHQVDEFLTELERDVDDQVTWIDRGVVRATPLYRTTGAGIKVVTVAASYVSLQRPHLSPWLVHVDAYAGQLWGNREADDETTERRDSLMAAIAGACERLGLEVRPGMFEVVTHS